MVIDLLQWPAMAVTLVAAWFVGSSRPERRKIGFWTFLLSNLLWIIWGSTQHAYALVALQIGLAVMNVRGEQRNRKAAAKEH